MTTTRKVTPYVLLIILACLASRLPLLLDTSLMLDGDECVVALMAKHAYLGKELPVFFWGQNYGFSLIEVLIILPFYALLGYTTIAVKLAMLSLWTIGVVFLYKTMVAINKDKRLFAFLLTLVFILSPTWSSWSMEARGGYLTSFTFTSISLYLLFNVGKLNDTLRYTLIGVCSYIVYIAQPFWLTGLVPLITYQLFKDKERLPLIALCTAAIASHIAIQAFSTNTEPIYVVHPNLEVEALLHNITRFPEYLYRSLQGNYSFSWYQDTTQYHRAYASAIRSLVFLLAIFSLLHLLFNRKGFGHFIIATVFIPLVLAYSLTTNDMQGRYLLPTLGFSLLALYIYSTRLRLSTLLNTSALIMVLIGGLSTLFFPVHFDGQSNREELSMAIDHVKKHHIKNLYATNSLLPWEVMFYSDETILCRMTHFPGRYPKYDTAVDLAFYAGEQTAIIGYWKEYAGLTLDSLDFENHYYISRNPTKELLKQAFEFPLPATFRNSNSSL